MASSGREEAESGPVGSFSSPPTFAQAVFSPGLPLRPRFLQELVLAPFDDGIIVDGTDHLQALRGKATRTLLPALIALTDGTRTLDQLKTALPGVPAEDVLAALSLLFDWGALEDAECDLTKAPARHPETLAYFRRYVGATRLNRSGSEAYQKLQASEALILQSRATLEQFQALSGMLEKSGIGSVTAIPAEGLNDWWKNHDRATRPLIISVACEREDQQWHSWLDDWCSENQLSWLRGVVDEDEGYADVGPLFKRGERPCYGCFCAVHARPFQPESQTLTGPSYVQSVFWSSMIAVEVIYLISQHGVPVTGNGCRRYDLRQWTTKALGCTRLPGCPRCAPVDKGLSCTNSDALTLTPVVYEDYVGLQSRAFAGLKIPQQHPRILEVIDPEGKRLPNCKQHILKHHLPKLAAKGAAPVREVENSRQGYALDELSSVLLMSGGIRDFGQGRGKLQRWAATAGNLGSVELYLAVRRVQGLEPGFYLYQPYEHSLALYRRRNGHLKIDEFMRRLFAGKHSGLPDVLVLFTGAFKRLARKYGMFANRLLNLDAGAAVSQLQFVASKLNIYCCMVTRWADDLIEEQLNLEPWAEQSTAVVALSWIDDFRQPEPIYASATSNSGSAAPASARAARDFFELPSEEVTRMLYRESRLSEQDLRLAASSEHFAHQNENLNSTAMVALPMLSSHCSDLEVLEKRVSVSTYTPAPITANQLGTMLHLACHHDAENWPEEHAHGRPLSFLAIAWRVDKIPPAIYRYDPESHILRAWRDIPSPEESVELFVQKEFSAAPCVIWIVGNLAGACARHGAFGHRQLLLRAGSAGHRLWMTAIKMGLSGSLIAGLVPGVARVRLGLDGYKRASLFAVASGYRAG